jgi:hypothetical protein
VPWGYAIAAVGTIVAGDQAAGAAGDAADAQVGAANAATAEQRRQYDLTRQDMQPWLQAGGRALNLQDRFLMGDASAYTESPDYQFRLQQGQQGLENSAAARGNLFGGGAAADLMSYNQGMATQGIDSWWNRLAGVSNTGQTTGGQLGQFGQAYGQQAGQNAMNAANARASSYAASSNAWGNALGQLGNLGGQWYGNQQGGGGQSANIGPVVKQPITY